MGLKKFTTWHPDTCGCVLVYSWDRDTTEDERVHTPETFEGCKHHQGLELHNGHAMVIEENQRKNLVVHLLAERVGVKPTELPFSFDEARKLVIRHASLTEDMAKQVMPEIETVHGKGKVILRSE